MTSTILKKLISLNIENNPNLNNVSYNDFGSLLDIKLG